MDKANYYLDKKEWIKEAKECLDYALSKLQKEYRNISIDSIMKKKILHDYYYYSAVFTESFIDGFMDSFERAACLMTAIQKNKILFYGDNQIKDFGKATFPRKGQVLNYKSHGELKATLALEAALKMCEDPICYDGKHYDRKKQLEHFELEKFKEKYPDEWKDMNYELMISGYYSPGKWNELVSKYLMLKYLYKYVNEKAKNITIKKEDENVLKLVKNYKVKETKTTI